MTTKAEPTIDTERYCWAFETWSSVALTEGYERDIITQVCLHLRQNFSGVRRTKELCEAFSQWATRSHNPNEPPNMYTPQGVLIRKIYKSCLLDRLIYAGEPLRTRMCSIHRGHWSGWSDTRCPEGCSFGMNLTGWIREPS